MTYDPAACNIIDLIAQHGLFKRTIGVVTRSDGHHGLELKAFRDKINNLLRLHPESNGKDLGERFVFTMYVRVGVMWPCLGFWSCAVEDSTVARY